MMKRRGTFVFENWIYLKDPPPRRSRWSRRRGITRLISARREPTTTEAKL